jgi:hypothetical protein
LPNGSGAPPGPPKPTPVFTETAGGRPTVPTLSEQETRIARTVGVKAETWQRATAALAKLNSGTHRGGVELGDD